jgi:hypothetical protein
VEDDVQKEEMLWGLVYRARWDEEFRHGMHKNPEETLAEYRYHLTDEEMAAVKAYHEEVIGMSDEELNERLALQVGQDWS